MMNHAQIKQKIINYTATHNSRKNKYYLFTCYKYIKHEYRNKQMKLCGRYRTIITNNSSRTVEYSRKLYLLIEQYRPTLSMIENMMTIHC